MSTGRICILDRIVAERIAAGEVVERLSTPTRPKALLKCRRLPIHQWREAYVWRHSLFTPSRKLSGNHPSIYLPV